MKASMTKQLLTVCLATMGTFAIAGCSNETEADRTEAKSKQLDQAAQMMREGQDEVASGKALEARGQTMKDQGQNDAGNSTIAEGVAKEKSGQAKIDAARDLKNK